MDRRAAMRRAAASDDTQARYARWLARGARVGMALMLAGFVMHATGIVPGHVSPHRLVSLWTMPLGEYLTATGGVRGWASWRLLHRADVLSLAGIAVLAGCSMLALAAVIPAYLRGRYPAMAWICALQIGVLAIAASGLFAVGH